MMITIGVVGWLDHVSNTTFFLFTSEHVVTRERKVSNIFCHRHTRYKCEVSLTGLLLHFLYIILQRHLTVFLITRWRIDLGLK